MKCLVNKQMDLLNFKIFVYMTASWINKFYFTTEHLSYFTKEHLSGYLHICLIDCANSMWSIFRKNNTFLINNMTYKNTAQALTLDIPKITLAHWPFQS